MSCLTSTIVARPSRSTGWMAPAAPEAPARATRAGRRPNAPFRTATLAASYEGFPHASGAGGHDLFAVDPPCQRVPELRQDEGRRQESAAPRKNPRCFERLWASNRNPL